MGFLDSLWNGLKSIFRGLGRLIGYLMPFNSNSKLPPAVRYLVWFVLVVILVAVLYFINARAGIGAAVQKQWAQRIYLPIIGVLVVLISVVVYWLYQLGQSEDGSAFPDIDEAWSEAMEALNHAGIRLPEEPLFLVL